MKNKLHHLAKALWVSDNIFAKLMLYPFCTIYFLLHLIIFYMISTPRRVPAFVVCVGNVTVGGVGKTQCCITLAKQLQENGVAVSFVTRGYGGAKCRGVRHVSQNDDVCVVGDEAKLLCNVADTFISQNRYAACIEAAKQGADVVIMDDGLQNNDVIKDYSILLIDGGRYANWHNGQLLPLGPLREPLWLAKMKANTIIYISNNDIMDDDQNIARGIICAASDIKPDPSVEYHVFCGIGNPERFIDTLVLSGYNVAKTTFFPDHYMYKSSDIMELLSFGYQLITTSKDATKIPKDLAEQIEVFDVKLKIV